MRLKSVRQMWMSATKTTTITKMTRHKPENDFPPYPRRESH